MAIRKRKTEKLVATNSAYIDPLTCDSTISYRIIDGTKRVYGNVQLADCNRKIEWYFGHDEAVEKINKTIAMLEEFRDALAAAKATRPKRRRKSVVKK